jgi:hypothetical protein
LWFTESNTNRIGRISSTGAFTEFPVATSNLGSAAIAVGPDGALWFIESLSKIGRITTSGVFTEYLIPGNTGNLLGLVAGPDGALWITDWLKIWRMTTSGAVTGYSTVDSFGRSITVGRDGALWFGLQSEVPTLPDSIGRMTTAGVFTNTPTPTIRSLPQGIAVGPDGSLWFTELQGNNIGTYQLDVGAPTITSLNPSGASAGGPAFTLTVNSSGFSPGDTVEWNGAALTTTFVSATQLSASVPATLIAQLGTASINVLSNDLLSNTLPFTIGVGSTVLGLRPSSATAGGPAFTLTVTGNAFAQGAVVNWNGSALATSFVTNAQLTASVPANLMTTAGTATITVLSGGVTSNGLPFTINPAPVITGLSPSSVIAGASGFSLTINGSGFTSAAVAFWNGSQLPTTFVGATQLTALVPSNLLTVGGVATITVVVGGATSNNATFTINAPILITGLSPASAITGGAAFTLTVNGSGFVSGAAVNWNGSTLSTIFVSAAQLTASVSASLIASTGTAAITVVSGGVTSNSVTFAINPPPPTITGFSPSSATAGESSFTLTVAGSGFASGAVVDWNGSALPTTFGSATQLTASVAASLIASAGTATITVVSGGVVSKAASFVIAAPIVQGLTISASGTGSGSSVMVQLGQAAPVNISGTLTAAFTPATGVFGWPANMVDPAAGFPVAQGSNPLTQMFTVNQSQIQSAAFPFNPGTVAGSWTITVTTLTGGVPATAAPYTMPVPLASPVIMPGSVKISFNSTNTQVVVQLSGYSTSRDVMSAAFTFTAAGGDQLTGTSVPVPFNGLDQSEWFNTSQMDGGTFGLAVPFAYTGDPSALGSVSVTLTNSIGTSSPVTGTP